MDPVRILDHYRLQLVESREAIQLLARLLRDGPQKTEDLVSSLDAAAADVNRLLTSLFRAAFVEYRKIDLWAISHLGEQVLERLQVLDLASVDIVKSLAPPPSDRVFLIRWLESQSAAKDSRTCLSLLRSLNQVRQLRSLDGIAPKQDPSSMLYAILIAGDSWAQQAGIENVADAIRIRLESHLLTGAHSRIRAEDNFSADSVASSWREGMHRYMGSNRLLLFMPNDPSPSADEETLQFTWLRALDAALGGTADQGLRASCQLWQRDDASAFWRLLFQRQNFAMDTRRMYFRWGGVDEPATEDLLSVLADRLLQAVGRTQPEQLESSVSSNAGRSDDFVTLISMLEAATYRVRTEGLEVVPRPSIAPLRAALTEFNEVFSRSKPLNESKSTEKRRTKRGKRR